MAYRMFGYGDTPTSYIARHIWVIIFVDWPKRLNRLLLFSNKMVHGDDGIRVEQSDLNDFNLLVQNFASDMIVSIVDGYIGYVSFR